MAKIRVYELAKDLNMTNRELLDKLEDFNIKVSSHMSSLDDEFIREIKLKLFSSLDKKVDEKRVHPTVIRRRKKTERTKKKSKTNLDIFEKDKILVSNKSFQIDDIQTTEAKNEILSMSKGIDEKLIPNGTHKKKQEYNTSDKPFATEESAKIISKPTRKNLVVNNSIDMTNKFKTIEKNTTNKENKFLEKEKFSNDGKFLIDKKNDFVKTSFPDTKLTVKTTGEKLQKKFLQDDDMRSSKTRVIETSKLRGNRIKKNVSTKAVRQKDSPAKIIRKADPLKSEPHKEHKEISFNRSKLVEQETNIIEKNNAYETKDRKSQKKKKILKKREVVEGAVLYSGKRKGRRSRKGSKSKFLATGQKTQITTAKAIKRRIKIDETIILADLAKRLGIKANEMITKLMSMGVMVTVNQTIDFDTACLVANEFSYEVEKASFEEESILNKTTDNDDPDKLVQRPPVVTIMGHVDHGKTSLLDAIRKTQVTEGEAGGITQHIGAYRVDTEKGIIAFLDTPGHEAFSAMRSRGAKVTDLVVLVVAADDGVMPQTVEAINHSKVSDVPILVAINKMDKIDANPERVLVELSKHGLVPEEWGGDTIVVKVSAKQNLGIDKLMEMILLQAEMLDLRANPDKLAHGHIVESRLDSGRGPVATVLVQEGTLRSGDSVICGMHYGKVRALQDDIGRKVNFAGPSMPVEIIGLSGVPMAGDELIALKDEKDARQVSIHRTQKQRAKELAKTNRLSLEGLFERMQKGEVKDLNLIIKADVDGSIEALKDSLVKLSNDEVDISIVHSATGSISESDVSLAAVSNAIIIGFNVRPNAKVQDFASDEHVDIRFYNIIYNVIKDVKSAIVGMMDSTYEERLLGRAKVRQVFHVPKIGTIAGCYVTDGKIFRGKLMRLLRDGVVVYQGKNSSLRRFKEDVKEVIGGYECGIGIENFNDIKIGDDIEAYYMEEIKPKIE